MKNIKYETRSCDCCGSDDLEEIWKYTKTVKPSCDIYTWHVRNVICRQCGFVFVSPVPTEESLKDYYGRTHRLFEGQRLDYSIENRVHVINKYLQDKSEVSYIEVGGSDNSQFIKQLPQKIKIIKNVELNTNYKKDNESLETLDSEKVDIIVAYFVLEHIAKPKQFFMSCSHLLKDNGILIIEVPNLYIYPVDPSGLALWEHTNHFSPRSLSYLASSFGFEALEISHRYCSRSFGFASVFKKTSNTKFSNLSSDYLIAKSYVLDGMEKLKEYPRMLQNTREKINAVTKNKGSVVIWVANAVCWDIMDNYQLPSQAIIVDSDPQKKDFFGHIPVYQPQEVLGKIKSASLLIINRRLHAQDILGFIHEKTGRVFKKDELVINDSV